MAIPDDHWAEDRKTLHDDGDYRVKYIPAEHKFYVRVVTPNETGDLSPGEARQIIKERDFPEEVHDAIELGLRMCQTASIMDLVGPEAVQAFKDGDLSAKELMQEFGRSVDRSLSERDEEEDW